MSATDDIVEKLYSLLAGEKVIAKIDQELDSLSMEALRQIDDKRYDAEMLNDGMRNILKLGIAFSGKKVKIKTQ